MGWKHPQISLQEMVNLVKGFVEILSLGSGYQSTGVFANWDVPNLRKALQWAEFFERFFLEFSNLEYYEESMKELDGVLSELTSMASFPQGLAHLSSTTLTRARKLVVEQLIRGLPLRHEHLRSVAEAAVETDLCGFSNVEDGSLSQYLNALTLQSINSESALFANDSSEVSWESCSKRDYDMEEKLVVGGYTGICIRALLKRQSSALRALDLATGQNVISHAVTDSNLIKCEETWRRGKQWAATTPMNEGNEQERVKLMIFHQWKARTLSFLLDKRTVRLVSGARILFAAPQAQWSQLLDQLNLPEELNGDSSGAKVLENTLIEYLTKVLNGRLSLLWKFHPILPAVAIPSSSHLFKVYLSKIESLLRDDPPTSRSCTCSREKEEHVDCELAERIWCLHSSHVCRSCLWDHARDR